MNQSHHPQARTELGKPTNPKLGDSMSHSSRTPYFRRAFVVLAAIVLPWVVFASGASASMHAAATSTVSSGTYHNLTVAAAILEPDAYAPPVPQPTSGLHQ
jgi:hypothetical protein